ncbi:MAG: hypothetical protein IPL23_27460 [Saprospiraceae bacterium]|nr:hypothetical protein [Saprospiraceae bacterium]MBK8635161.1 hypothetical protein [Saprospiraceae bacterium]MBP7642518.1 hypothetical protein [Saprospiraceae bacterium]
MTILDQAPRDGYIDIIKYYDKITVEDKNLLEKLASEKTTDLTVNKEQ